MKKDNEITASVSPFAVKPGETKVWDGSENYSSTDKVISKANRGHFNERDRRIIQIVNMLEFCTPRQVNKILKLEGQGFEKIKKLSDKMTKFRDDKLLARYYFDNIFEESDAKFKVYSLDKIGKQFLSAEEILENNWVPTDTQKSLGLVKSRLAANQLLIAFKEKSKNLVEFKVKVPITGKTLNSNIKTHGQLTIGQGIKKINVLVEAPRRSQEGQIPVQFVNRLKVYDDFLKNFKMGDSNFASEPYLVFTCEDMKHMAEVYKEIVMNNLFINKKIYFTHDLIQNEETLTKTWFEFVKSASRRSEASKSEYRITELDSQNSDDIENEYKVYSFTPTDLLNNKLNLFSMIKSVLNKEHYVIRA